MTRFRNPRAASVLLALAGATYVVVAVMNVAEEAWSRVWLPALAALLFFASAAIYYRRSTARPND